MQPPWSIATSRETTHTDPTVTIHGVQHYAVGNMPGAVPFTSTEALVSVTLPYILGIAGRGLEEAVTERPELRAGIRLPSRGRQGPWGSASAPDGLPALVVQLKGADVKPLPSERATTALKQRRLHQHPLLVPGLKANGSLQIIPTTPIDGMDRQAQPRRLTAGLEQGAGRRRLAMGATQVVHLPFGEGGITGTHQLFGGLRPPLPTVERPATAAVLTTSTGAGAWIQGEASGHQVNRSSGGRGRCKEPAATPSRSASSQPAASA